jgi:regulatory protein
LAFGHLSIKSRALRYLAQREHSRAELQRKLARFVEDTSEHSAPALIAAALDELTAHDLLSDDRTAQSVLRSQGQRYGARRLQQTLQAKGLAAELVADTLAQARGTELQRAQAVWLRRYGVPAATAAERAKQMRFLAGRGFGGDTIRSVMKGQGAADADADAVSEALQDARSSSLDGLDGD